MQEEKERNKRHIRNNNGWDFGKLMTVTKPQCNLQSSENTKQYKYQNNTHLGISYWYCKVSDRKFWKKWQENYFYIG